MGFSPQFRMCMRAVSTKLGTRIPAISSEGVRLQTEPSSNQQAGRTRTHVQPPISRFTEKSSTRGWWRRGCPRRMDKRDTPPRKDRTCPTSPSAHENSSRHPAPLHRPRRGPPGRAHPRLPARRHESGRGRSSPSSTPATASSPTTAAASASRSKPAHRLRLRHLRRRPDTLIEDLDLRDASSSASRWAPARSRATSPRYGSRPRREGRRSSPSLAAVPAARPTTTPTARSPRPSFDGMVAAVKHDRYALLHRVPRGLLQPRRDTSAPHSQEAVTAQLEQGRSATAPSRRWAVSRPGRPTSAPTSRRSTCRR